MICQRISGVNVALDMRMAFKTLTVIAMITPSASIHNQEPVAQSQKLM